MFDLLLDTTGLVLKRHKGRFLVRHKKEGARTFSPYDIRYIIVGAPCLISTGALQLAIAHGIPVLLLDKVGRPVGRMWSPSLEGLADLRIAQAFFSVHEVAMRWMVQVFRRKAEQQLEVLAWLQRAVGREAPELVAARDSIDTGMRQLDACAETGLPPDDMRTRFMTLEAGMARAWWAAVAALMPSPWSFEGRSRRPARDPFNAGLNYLYGMLYGTTETALMRAGLDPYVGIFHRDDFNRPALVFDVIERFRMWIDYVVLRLAMSDAMPRECFSESEDGAVRLEGLGKRILIQSVNDYLSEVIPYEGLERSRETHLRIYAQKLASHFLEAAGMKAEVQEEEE